MHACGHDAHTAIAAGVALMVAGLELPGRIRFVFQPGEESFPGGALTMVGEGVTEGMAAILAFHVDPSLAAGHVGLRSGPITGSADRFTVVLEGPGGHTARPHRSIDLVYAAGRLVTELPAVLDRTVDSRRPLTVVFGQINGGSAPNVIPTRVEATGTARTTDRGLWEQLPLLVESLASQIVAPLGAKATVHYVRGIPPVVNDPGVVNAARVAIGDYVGSEAITSTPVSMGAEDFSFMLQAKPGAYIFLGQGGGPNNCFLHNPGYDFNDEALPLGVRWFCEVAARALARPAVV